MDESSNLFVRMGSRRSTTADVPVPESGDSIVRFGLIARAEKCRIISELQIRACETIKAKSWVLAES